MARTKTVVEYEVDYEAARVEAEKIAREIVSKHTSLSYSIVTKYDTGVLLELYGQNENLIDRIRNSLRKRQMKLILQGKPVYFIYGGPKRPEDIFNLSDGKQTKRKKAR